MGEQYCDERVSLFESISSELALSQPNFCVCSGPGLCPPLAALRYVVYTVRPYFRFMDDVIFAQWAIGRHDVDAVAASDVIALSCAG